MAIHPTLRRSHTASQNNLSPQQAIAISVWTEQAAASLQDLSLSESVPGDDRSAPATATVTRQTACGTSVSLAIPLDDEVYTAESKAAPRVGEPQKVSVSFRRRPPIRRDSLKRREALLKGKDGSRRRQRWENGMSSTSVDNLIDLILSREREEAYRVDHTVVSLIPGQKRKTNDADQAFPTSRPSLEQPLG